MLQIFSNFPTLLCPPRVEIFIPKHTHAYSRESFESVTKGPGWRTELGLISQRVPPSRRVSSSRRWPSIARHRRAQRVRGKARYAFFFERKPRAEDTDCNKLACVGSRVAARCLPFPHRSIGVDTAFCAGFNLAKLSFSCSGSNFIGTTDR